MKSRISRLVAAMLVVVCIVALTACGGGGNSAFDGKWESAYMEMGDFKVKTPNITIEIKGAKGTYAIGEGAEQESAPIKVEYKDGKAIITIEDVDPQFFPVMRAVMVDGNLVIENYLGDEAQAKLILTKDLKNFKFPEGVQE